MKITLVEHDGCFAFQMAAETMADAALLVRFATNRKNEISSANAIASANGQFSGSLVVGKHKHADGFVQRRR